MEIFKKANKEMGVSILMNLHYLNTAKEFCDRILGIKNGQIIFNGKPEELNEDIVNEIYNNKSWI
jgi:phosphonate transport system ATP-binding protein